MSLELPNLDNRKHQDIVDEAKKLIPQYCPEWTNHNLSDPGVALIELFAWMTDLTLYRLNQVPDVFYTHMLNLMGIEPFPAAAAQADLTFWLVEGERGRVEVPEGTEVATTGDSETAVIFRTLGLLTIDPPELVAGLTHSEATGYDDIWDRLRVDREHIPVFTSEQLEPGEGMYFGFADSLANSVVRLDINAHTEGIGIDPNNPPLAWEVSAGESRSAWAEVDVHLDTTGGLNRAGSVTLLIKRDHTARTLGGRRAYWLRVRHTKLGPNQPDYEKSPEIADIEAVTVGGTVRAEHSASVESEVLGVSSGEPDQLFQLAHFPVLPRRPDEVIRVITGEGADDWQEVDDFIQSGPKNNHVVLDPTTGQVRFGPRIRYPDGTVHQHGAIPREGSEVVVSRYRYGGGIAGNVGAYTIMRMRSTLSKIARVENIEASFGGVDAEPPENAKARGPYVLRSGDRAVTAPDFKRLAESADAAVARVECFPPERTGEPVRVLVVPAVDAEPIDMVFDELALSDELRDRVCAHLDERRILGSTVEVGAPYYQGVSVAALINASRGRVADPIIERANAALYRFVNPLKGGPSGEGWPFGVDLNAAAIYNELEQVDGVDSVEEILLFDYDLRNGRRIGFGRDVIKLRPHTLFMSARHRIVVR